MSETTSQKTKEMTTNRALFGFFAPILVLIILIAMGADVTIGALAALFVMIVFCFYMGYKWEYIDQAMAEGVKQIATAAMIMLFGWLYGGCMDVIRYNPHPSLLRYENYYPKSVFAHLLYSARFHGSMCRYKLGGY